MNGTLVVLSPVWSVLRLLTMHGWRIGVALLIGVFAGEGSADHAHV